MYFGGKFEPQTSLTHSFVYLHWTEHGFKTEDVPNFSVRMTETIWKDLNRQAVMRTEVKQSLLFVHPWFLSVGRMTRWDPTF